MALLTPDDATVLSVTSVALLNQIRALDGVRLAKRVGSYDAKTLDRPAAEPLYLSRPEIMLQPRLAPVDDRSLSLPIREAALVTKVARLPFR